MTHEELHLQQQVGAKLRQLLKERKIAHRDFAQSIHVPKSQLRKWLCGQIPLDLLSIKPICQRLRIPYSKLLGELNGR